MAVANDEGSPAKIAVSPKENLLMPRVSKQDGGHSSFRIEPVSQSIQVSGECRYDVESNQ